MKQMLEISATGIYIRWVYRGRRGYSAPRTPAKTPRSADICFGRMFRMKASLQVEVPAIFSNTSLEVAVPAILLNKGLKKEWRSLAQLRSMLLPALAVARTSATGSSMTLGKSSKGRALQALRWVSLISEPSWLQVHNLDCGTLGVQTTFELSDLLSRWPPV